jgi:3-phosphoshikimate 1-carboxyvinyltransferase
LRRFGAEVEVGEAITVEGPLRSPGSVETPGDYALSAFYMVGASITGGRAVVEGLSEGPDKEILDVLKEFGVGVRAGEGFVEVEGPPKGPVDVDLANAPDLAPPVALLASFTPGVSKIRGVEHLAYKESNRIETIIDVVRRAGASAEYEDGALKIIGPAKNKGAEYKCHGDHRICLMALVAAKALGGCVDDLSPIAKSWPTALLNLSG